MPTTPLYVSTLPNGLLYVAPGAFLALGNYISGPLKAPHAQTQTAANEVAIYAVALPVLYTGVFDVDCHAIFVSGTTGKTVNTNLVLMPFTAPATRFATTGTPDGGSTYLAASLSPQTTTSWCMLLGSDAAGTTASGLTFNGVAPISSANAAYKPYARTQDTLTGLLANGDLSFDFSGVVVNSTGLPFPVTAGSFVVAAFTLGSTAGTDVVTFKAVHMSLKERPLA